MATAPDLPFYVINLDRSPERWSFMEEMGAERGIQLQRVSAVDGLALSQEELERVCPPINGFLSLAAPEIGCYESHKEVWRLIAEGEHTHGFVLEDDVYLSQNISTLCAEVVSAFPELDLVKFNNYLRPIYLSRKPLGSVGAVELFRPMQVTIDAGAYLMSRECARTMLASSTTFCEAVDNVLFSPLSPRSIAQLVPAAAMQQKYAPFRFLDPAASRSTIHRTRVMRWEEARRRRLPQPRSVRFRKEMARIWRRRLAPSMLFVTNRLRRPEHQLMCRMIDFVDL